MLSHEGVSEGRRGTRASAQVTCVGMVRMIQASGVRMIWTESQMIRLQWKPSGVFGTLIQMIQRGVDDPAEPG